MDTERQRRALELFDMVCRAISEGPLDWRTGLPISIGDLHIEQPGFMRMGRPAADRPSLADTPDIEVIWRGTTVLSVGHDRKIICYEPGEWERELEFLLVPGHGRTQ